jgi:hypothetical protein
MVMGYDSRVLERPEWTEFGEFKRGVLLNALPSGRAGGFVADGRLKHLRFWPNVSPYGLPSKPTN